MALQHPTVSWANGSNIYEVNLRQYTTQGTFLAFANHLPRLKAMGVDVLWFMPITPISINKRQGSLGSYYACSSYTDTNPEFGSIAQFQYLVRLAHENGMRVIIDWVANHTGCDHKWMYTNPEWFLKNEQGQFYDRNGWVDVADLDYSQPAMRKAMIEAMLF
ncbi:MAG TPA: 1,4-alpha-glucan branching protein, partial [Chitinophagaceae bacterium]|nr:1,4-alpha-glucan branching protein [Chitinophagaceae bacterium]